jgi:hypothetical protein
VTVSLLEILAAARSHAAPLAAESAGYLLLAVADHVLAAPRAVAPDDVELLQDGAVRLRSRSARDSAGAEHFVRRLLARTLEVSSSVGPALRRAAERRDDTGLSALVRELEAALIPVNRGAAKRALSRLHRETERARDSGKLAALLAAESAAHPDEVAPADVVPAAPSPVALPLPVTETVVAAPAPSPPPEVFEPSPVALPAVVAVAPAPRAPSPPPPAPALELTLTPPPGPHEPTPALTKPEPVVLRAKERGNSTPRLGTVVTAQTLPDEEAERTERAPTAILIDDEPAPPADIEIDVELEAMPDASEDELTPVRASATAAAPQPLLDPEPSQLPDVVTAMLELHTGLDADDAPTRLRDVVTELLAVVQPVPLLTPEPQQVEDAWLTQSSLDEVATSAEALDHETPPSIAEVVDPALFEAATWNPGPVVPIAVAVAVAPAAEPEPAPEPEPEPAPEPEPEPEPEPLVLYAFESERLDPAQHEALTWYPAPVTSEVSPLPPALLLTAAALEPSPYAPAVLPAPRHDVADLVDSFYVSGGSEDAQLRSALKEMAGIELTPLPHPLIEEG